MSFYPEYLLISSLPPRILKVVALALLFAVTGIFIFFPACIFSGATVCWDYDVTDPDHRIVLLVASAVILLVSGWIWYRVIRDPKMRISAARSVATFIIIVTVIVGLIILILATSPYWAPFVGH